MARLSVFLILTSFYGLVHGQFNGPFRPEAQFSPRFSAGSGNDNYNSYNGPDYGSPNQEYDNGGPSSDGPGPTGGDPLSEFGLSGLNGFYSALSNELINAGSSFSGSSGKANITTGANSISGSVITPASAESTNNSPAPLPAYNNFPARGSGFGDGNTNEGVTANGNPVASSLNLGDTTVLKQYGLEQLGTFFGSMVSELNNAGNTAGVKGSPPTSLGNGNPVASVSTTPESQHTSS